MLSRAPACVPLLCAGCGACMVTVARKDATSGAVVQFSANSCLRQVAMMDGEAVVTVEGLGSVEGGLHPIQVPNFLAKTALLKSATVLASSHHLFGETHSLPCISLHTRGAKHTRAQERSAEEEQRSKAKGQPQHVPSVPDGDVRGCAPRLTRGM